MPGQVWPGQSISSLTTARVADAVAADYDVGVVGFRLLGAVLADHLCVSDFLASVAGDIVKLYHIERVGSLHAFLG